MVGPFAKVGKDLGKATDAYNKAVSVEGRKAPAGAPPEDMQFQTTLRRSWRTC